MSSESLIVILAVGLIAGWLAGQIVQGTGYGIINDLIIGVVGSFIGGWLLPQLGLHLGVGIVAAIINATVGALLLLLVLRTRSRRRPPGRRMGWALGLAPLALSSPFANGTSRGRALGLSPLSPPAINTDRSTTAGARAWSRSRFFGVGVRLHLSALVHGPLANLRCV